ncbi:hypothetical protein N0V90_005919 [Kalmusia sp. IMI 367209]|nr:hypothetical protein N0V90_005919 [Kalmusia sp. IMI 367209]
MSNEEFCGVPMEQAPDKGPTFMRMPSQVSEYARSILNSYTRQLAARGRQLTDKARANRDVVPLHYGNGYFPPYGYAIMNERENYLLSLYERMHSARKVSVPHETSEENVDHLEGLSREQRIKSVREAFKEKWFAMEVSGKFRFT